MHPTPYPLYIRSIYVVYHSPVILHYLSITRYRQHPSLTISRALPPSGQPHFDDNMDNALTLALYNEENEQSIHSIRKEQITSPWGLQQNILVPPPSSGISDRIEDVISSTPLYIRQLTVGPSQVGKDKERVPASRTQTPFSAGIRQIQALQAEVRRLEADKIVAPQKVGKLLNKQASTSSFLQQTVADVQNLLLASTIA